ncbi:MAG: sulfite exporter TauE/SafE family protein [Acidimicrobiales bacterium]
MDPLSPSGLAVVGVGLASGVLSGMVGIGGAVVTTPGIRFLGATPIEAIGSTIPAILPSALSGTWRYARAGLVDWRIALTCGVLGSGFAVLGAEVSSVVNAHALMLLTAGLLAFSAWQAARPRPPAPADATQPPLLSLVRLAAVGAAAGFVAGLLGVGGGIIMVPAFVAVLHLPLKVAVASSLVSVAIFSVPAMAAHAWLGHIDWTFALLLVAGVIPGAQLGAHLTIAGSEDRLRLVIAVLLGVVAVAYGARELAALV